MQTSSREFLSMTTSTRLANWFGAINPVCAVYYANLPGPTSLSQTIWLSKPSCAPTRTSGVFAAKRAFPRGFTGSPTIVFEKTRVAGRNLWESMRNNSKRNTILRSPILL